MNLSNELTNQGQRFGNRIVRRRANLGHLKIERAKFDDHTL